MGNGWFHTGFDKIHKPNFLPYNEKAVKLAIGAFYFGLFALSSSGKLYYSTFNNNDSRLWFLTIPELETIKYIDVSAGIRHCLAVSDDGKVFGFGTNEVGQLGLGKEIKNADHFIEIESLKSHKIISVFAGEKFSFFITSEKKVLICGINSYAKCQEPAFEPKILDIPKCDSFYVTSKFDLSPIFINCELPYSPDRPIKYSQ